MKKLASVAVALTATLSLSSCSMLGGESPEFTPPTPVQGSSSPAGADASSLPKGKLSPKQAKALETELNATMNSVKSFVLTGTSKEQGKITIRHAVDGTCEVTSSKPGPARVIIQGNVSYIKASPVFWRSIAGPKADQILSMARGRWLKMSGGVMGDNPCDAKTLESKSKKIPTIINRGVIKYQGRKVVKLEYKSPDPSESGTLLIAATGPKHMVSLRTTNGEMIEISQVNKVVKVTVPSGNQVLTLPSGG